MVSDSIQNKVEEIFRDVMDLPELELNPELSAESLEQWDSLSHINLIAAIERNFKIKFALGELEDMKNVADLLAAIDKKIA